MSPQARIALALQEHIEKLEDSPFKNTYKEWLYYNTLLLRYYTPSYMDAATPQTGR